MSVTKLGDFCFKLLRYLMLGIAVFWLGASLFWPMIIINKYKSYLWGTIILILMGALIWFCVKKTQKGRMAYAWLIQHKLGCGLFALAFQMALLLSATMMIHSDAAVVFNGAIKDLEAHRVASYLTRNPNNIMLFLYERAFYKFLGSWAIWVLQGLNILYTHVAGWLLYKAAQRFFSQTVADRVFAFYFLLIILTPKFMTMYTDIVVLPLLAGQMYLILNLLQTWDEDKLKIWRILSLGVLTGLAILLRPTAVIILIAFFAVAFWQKNWRKFFIFLLLFILSFGAAYLPLSVYSHHQKELVLIKGEGLSKNWLTFINLGLTFSGTDQEDMKSGLAAYLPPEKRDIYNNGRFANDYQIAEIKRRIEAYTPWTFLLHILYKQALTTGQGNLNWFYEDASREKSSYMSPLTNTVKNNPLAGFFRDFFIYTDQPKFQYYDFAIQLVWIGLSVGVVAFFWSYADSRQNRLLTLSLFGGLLFLQIFEGGKSRYLIQFLPQILLIASLGWETALSKVTAKGKDHLNLPEF